MFRIAALLPLTLLAQTLSTQRPMSIDDRIAQMAACDNVAILWNVHAGGQTTFIGQVAEIVKQTGRALQPRADISFVGTGAIPLWKQDTRYLMCLNRRNQSQQLAGEHIYEIQGGSLGPPLFADGPAPDNNLLYDKPEYNVVSAIRDAAGVKVRQIWRSQQPIASQLLPGDVVVEIRVLAVAMPAPEQSRESELSTYSYTDDVLLVRELERRPVLTADGSWIRTRVRALVERAYKTKNLGATAGATVEYDYDGGEMTINGVLVKTMHEPVFRDRRQLVAFRLYDTPFGGGMYVQPIKLFGVSDEGILQRWQFQDGIPSPASKLYGVHLDEIENELRKVR